MWDLSNCIPEWWISLAFQQPPKKDSPTSRPTASLERQLQGLVKIRPPPRIQFCYLPELLSSQNTPLPNPLSKFETNLRLNSRLLLNTIAKAFWPMLIPDISHVASPNLHFFQEPETTDAVLQLVGQSRPDKLAPFKARHPSQFIGLDAFRSYKRPRDLKRHDQGARDPRRNLPKGSGLGLSGPSLTSPLPIH